MVIRSQESPVPESADFSDQISANKKLSGSQQISDLDENDDMETAAIVVFHPLFTYRRELARRARDSSTTDEDDNRYYIRRSYYLY